MFVFKFPNIWIKAFMLTRVRDYFDCGKKKNAKIDSEWTIYDLDYNVQGAYLWAAILVDLEKYHCLNKQQRPLKRTPECQTSYQNKMRRQTLIVTEGQVKTDTKVQAMGSYVNTMQNALSTWWKISCIIIAEWGSEFSNRSRDNKQQRDWVFQSQQRCMDSPRLLFPLVLFSCSCSNRTVNSNINNSTERCWLTESAIQASCLTCTLTQVTTTTIMIVKEWLGAGNSKFVESQGTSVFVSV